MTRMQTSLSLPPYANRPMVRSPEMSRRGIFFALVASGDESISSFQLTCGTCDAGGDIVLYAAPDVHTLSARREDIFLGFPDWQEIARATSTGTNEDTLVSCPDGLSIPPGHLRAFYLFSAAGTGMALSDYGSPDNECITKYGKAPNFEIMPGCCTNDDVPFEGLGRLNTVQFFAGEVRYCLGNAARGDAVIASESACKYALFFLFFLTSFCICVE